MRDGCVYGGDTCSNEVEYVLIFKNHGKSEDNIFPVCRSHYEDRLKDYEDLKKYYHFLKVR